MTSTAYAVPEKEEDEKERIEFSNKLMSNIKETAEEAAKRMAEVLKGLTLVKDELGQQQSATAVHQNTINAKLDGFIVSQETRRKEDVVILNKFILDSGINHVVTGEIQSNMNDLITIWNRYQTPRATPPAREQEHGSDPKQNDDIEDEARPGTPPTPTPGMLCKE